MWLTNFFPLCELPFHNIDSFVVQKLFSLMWSHLITFSFLACAFGVTSKKSLPRPLAKSFFFMLSPRSLMVSSLTQKS